MKTFLTVPMVLVLLAGPVRAANREAMSHEGAAASSGQISQDALARMGLGGLQPMSKSERSEIRGIPSPIWLPEGMTYTISAFQYRQVFQWYPVPLLAR